MPLVPNAAVFQQRLAGLPIVKYQTGETVLSAGSTDGRLLVLRSGEVEVLKDGVQIAKVSAPGAVFGELAVLLDQSHTADVRALEQSEFHVADALQLPFAAASDEFGRTEDLEVVRDGRRGHAAHGDDLATGHVVGR